MPKPINPRLHSFIDYSSAAATALAPRLLDFPPAAARAADLFAGAYTPFAAMTKTPAALSPRIPLRVHRNADIALAGLLPALPWMLGFAGHRAARNFFLGLTAFSIAVIALTDWDAEPATA